MVPELVVIKREREGEREREERVERKLFS